ncbi:nitroreductase family protein [Nocardia sp. 2]|uniref:Nitroreductase family protein n=1 Tax=Nocardia acididurans TaxID=2802282 RepID=A0ABS1M9P7_9NOCA|nr:nitroreductase family protein [Nocardia acididurans]MBL1077372.1 nitroreductase family protein [Nocardia acididurans]
MAKPERSPVALGADAPVFEIMRTMRAMRRLRPDPVPEDVLTQLIEAATWAPSGGNAQSFRFVVVTDRARISKVAELWREISTFYIEAFGGIRPPGTTAEMQERLGAALLYQRDHFHETPALIVACYDPSEHAAAFREQARHIMATLLRLGPRRALTVLRNMPNATRLGGAASTYPAVQNLLLAARTLGLGATITTWHLMLESEFKAALDIPKAVQTYAIIPVGWPRGKLGPTSRRPAAEVIHRDHW